MRSKKHAIVLRSAALLLAGSLAAAVANAQATPVAKEILTANGLMLEPTVEWEQARLVVAGPEGYRVEKWYLAPEPIVFTGDPSGVPLRNGFYRYELFLLGGSDRLELHRGGLLVERGRVALASLRGELKDRPRSELDHGPAMAADPVEPRDITDPGDIRAGGGLVAGSTTVDPSVGGLNLVFGGEIAEVYRALDGMRLNALEGPSSDANLWLGDDGNAGIGTFTPKCSPPRPPPDRAVRES